MIFLSIIYHIFLKIIFPYYQSNKMVNKWQRKRVPGEEGPIQVGLDLSFDNISDIHMCGRTGRIVWKASLSQVQ